MSWVELVTYTLLQSPELLPLLLRISTEVRWSSNNIPRTGLSGCLVLPLRPPAEPSMARLRLGLFALPRSDLVPV